MKANSDKSKQSNKATRRVLAGVLCGASVLSLVLSLVMPPISQAIANDAQTVSTEETVMGGGSSSESTDVDNTNNGDTEKLNSGDAENEANEDTVAPDSTADDAEAEGAAQPSDAQTSDDENSDESAIAPASVSDDDYAEVNGDVSGKFGSGGKFQLTGPAYSDKRITISKNTTIDLNGNMLCNRSGGLDSFFLVKERATLTIEDLSKKTNDVSRPVDTAKTPAGQLASMEWEKGSGSNNVTPKSLTYYETKSTPNTNGLGTTETTYEHVVTGFGAIDAASESGSVKYVVNVEAGGILNLKGGMITTAANLSNDGHVIFSQGTVKIEGGYVTNGNGGGWGGGLCVTGAKASLEMTGGVVAGNKAASGGGIYADRGATLKLTGGIISGNATYGEAVGLGGGILVSGGSVTVSGGYITNNKYAKFCGTDGNGDHGGAGLAAKNGAHVTISGGQITGNYSEEAGGGVYVTDIEHKGASSRKTMAWLNITGGTIASNVSFRSEGAGIRVGQMVDAMIKGTSNSNPVYITNNHCMSRYDWGGGGIFVQGDSDNASNAGRLFVYNSYISSNEAGGYGGGAAVCPTGKTLVTGTDGTAIFGNTSAGNEQNANDYESVSNKGNNGTPHLSGGGHGKDQDSNAYNAKVFRENGHADFFLAAENHTTPIAAVIGKMLGGGDAEYSGSKELTQAITIPANGGVQVYNSIGLSSGVKAKDDAATRAQGMATTFITGNYSWNHGGGIMSNGDLYLGAPEDTYVYPSLKLKATKALKNTKTNESETLAENQFTFKVYRKNSTDPLANATFDCEVCTEVGTATNDANGNITFDLGEQFATSGAGNEITYYLVEDAGTDSDITYDSAVYQIVVSTQDNPTELMTVPKKDDPNQQVALKIHNYTIENVSVTKHKLDKSSGKWDNVGPWSVVRDSNGYYPIACNDSSATFTNVCARYDSKGSWTPAATKVVEGGEMKEFTLEFADNEKFDKAETVETKANGKNSQLLSFNPIEYKLGQLNKLETDSTGRGASKTFTYFVREQRPTTPFTNYKYDQSVYQITVNATDDSNHHIDITATYKQIQDRDGKPVTTDTDHELTDSSTPIFTNIYSTSLPLSGMSGITLTYLAGAATLCVAAAWMHVRRKASAKGGERRE